ncbi:hypothetical protein F443_03835 [Phytophthora nicotianae P1569]|uniref:Uncharacterized protein n=1 Tax=Phytophthora nicotianae P1569 TaxID=1317065 RepID=V9FS17_PHYNI|nr:hypothetical protein F443_03835 [Phytophthora nicotianae P1569]
MDMRPATSSTPAPPTSSHASPSVSSEQSVALSGERRLLGLLRPDPEGHSDMDSDDSVWEPVSKGSSAESSTEEVQDGLSDEVSMDEIAEDRSINLCGEDFHDKVVGLILRDKCNDRFLQGKAAELEDFLRSTSNMTAQEKSRAF